MQYVGTTGRSARTRILQISYSLVFITVVGNIFYCNDDRTVLYQYNAQKFAIIPSTKISPEQCQADANSAKSGYKMVFCQQNKLVTGPDAMQQKKASTDSLQWREWRDLRHYKSEYFS